MPDCHSKGKKKRRSKGIASYSGILWPGASHGGSPLLVLNAPLLVVVGSRGGEKSQCHLPMTNSGSPTIPTTTWTSFLYWIGFELNDRLDWVGIGLGYRNGFKWWNSFDFSWWLAKSSFSDNHEIWMSDRLKPYHSPVKTWGSFGWLSWNGFPCCKRNNTISLN